MRFASCLITALAGLALAGCTALYEFGEFGDGDAAVDDAAVGDAAVGDASIDGECLSAPAPTGARLALGQQGGCALRGAEVKCWGSNTNSQLGVGSGPPVAFAVASPIAEFMSTQLQLVAAYQTRCAVLGTELSCWGENRGGALSPVGASSPQPVPRTTSFIPWVQVALGDGLLCRASGTEIRCSGSDADERLGGFCPMSSCDDELIYTLDPVTDCDGGNGVVQLASGHTHTCALMATGRLVCFGTNANGELGQTMGGGMGPVEVASPGGGGWDEVDVGLRFTCARQGTGVYCWGSNAVGELGLPASMMNRHLPQRVPDTGMVMQITVGNRHACALNTDGQVVCWGKNLCGELARPFSLSGPPMVVHLDGAGTPLSGLVEVRAGTDFTCARRDTNEIFCWGRDDMQQVADAMGPDQVNCGPMPGVPAVSSPFMTAEAMP